MVKHQQTGKYELHALIRKGEIRYAGNARLKIYGTLSCTSGKRIKKQNRLFFTDEREAIEGGFRPCGHCLRVAFSQWKSSR